MKTTNRNLLALMVITLFSVSPVLAQEADHRSCNSDAMVKAGKMGMVDEAALQAHIDKVKKEMKRARHAKARKRVLKKHLSNMHAAMQELHNQMYAGGCEEAMHDASIETRVEVLETRMNMNKMM